jgi:hypothetical protein
MKRNVDQKNKDKIQRDLPETNPSSDGRHITGMRVATAASS